MIPQFEILNQAIDGRKQMQFSFLFNERWCHWVSSRVFVFAMATVIAGLISCDSLSAQNLAVDRYGGYYWDYYRPGDVVAARMHAYADVVRSYGYGASKYGDYLIKRERAISMNLDNRMKRLKYYFDAKRINRAYREETHYDVRERQMLSNIVMCLFTIRAVDPLGIKIVFQPLHGIVQVHGNRPFRFNKVITVFG